MYELINHIQYKLNMLWCVTIYQCFHLCIISVLNSWSLILSNTHFQSPLVGEFTNFV